MKYRYTLVYWMKGLNLSLPDSQIDVLTDDSLNLRAMLSNSIDPEVDQRTALAGLTLKGKLDISQSDTDLNTRLSSELASIKEDRSKKYSSSSCFLSIATEGDIDGCLSEHTKEFDQFSVGFSDLDKELIYLSISNQVTAIITSLALLLPNFLGVEEVTNAVVLYGEDGKAIYPLNFKAGRLSLYVSVEPDIEQISSTKDIYSKLMSEQNIARSSRLLVSSLQTLNDRLRAFIFAWTSLEIFVNKSFNNYKEKLEKEAINNVNEQERHSESIEIIKQDRYSLVDKFTVISSQICFDNTDRYADKETFKKTKKQRDSLLHGEDINEEDLLVTDIQNLSRKYLLHHIRVGKS